MRWTLNCRPMAAVKTIPTSVVTMALLVFALLCARMESAATQYGLTVIDGHRGTRLRRAAQGRRGVVGQIAAGQRAGVSGLPKAFCKNA